MPPLAIRLQRLSTTRAGSVEQQEPAVDCAAVLKELEKAGTAPNRKALTASGVKGTAFGAPDAAIAALAKKIGTNHELAHELWKSANFDARVLATMVADPKQLNAAQVDRWARDAGNGLVAEAAARIAARAAAINAGVKFADAKRWSDSPDEWIGTLGWTMIAVLSEQGVLPEKDSVAALDRIERGIATAKNRTRHAMNLALIGIGVGITPLRERSLAIAERIGKLEVNLGKPGENTPDAHAAISKGKSGGKAKSAAAKKPAANGKKPVAAATTVVKKKTAAAAR
jgi:3-methyladenine DNA glycosylase AlkD